MLNKKFVAVIGSSTCVVLVPQDGSETVTLVGRDLITTEDLIRMVGNINRDGYTTLNESLSVNLLSAVEAWLKANQIEGVNTEVLAEQATVAIEEKNDGLTLFMNRVRSTDVSAEHKQQIIDFIARSGMSVTIDGNIIGFRRVRLHQDAEYPVDCFTGKVPNRLFSRVFMKREDVTISPTSCCAPGLHVASYDYISSYGGNICQLVLVEPENIVSVPYTDRTKMRVCEYKIIHQFTEDETREVLREGVKEGKYNDLLVNFINGEIPDITHSVNASSETPELVPLAQNIKGKAASGKVANVNVTKTNEKEKPATKKIDIKTVKSGSVFNELVRLYKSETEYAHKKSRFQDLLAHKRRQKKSWKTLGADEALIKELTKWEKQ